MYLLDLLLCFLFSFLLHSSNSGLSFYIDNITDILNWTTNIINSEAVCIGYESQYDNHGRSGLYYMGEENIVKGNNIYHTP